MKIAPFYLLLLLLAVSCEGPEGPKSLVDMADEPAGANCPDGGVRISSGIDGNGNDILDAEEVSMTKFVCNGSNGVASLLTTTMEPQGTNCSAGGTKIQFGQDLNSNNQLEASEVQQTRFVCNGVGGPGEIRLVTVGLFTDGPTDVPTIYSLYKDFDKENYSGYDSIVFMIRDVSFMTYGGTPINDPNLTLTAEIVNITNSNAAIAGSRMAMTDGSEPHISTNFFDDLPNGTIEIGVRFWVNSDGVRGLGSGGALIIGRK